MFNSNITSAFLAPPICTPTTMEITSLDSLDHHFLIEAEQSDFKETTTNTFVSHNPFISLHGNSSADDGCWEVPRSSSIPQHNYTQPNYDDQGFVNTVDINKIAIRTKSAIEIMDDGYKWRKYGKKMIKNSPNPRNYYRCSTGGCKVKKRVERERDDPRFVVTTYEGKHNHENPSPFNYSTTFPHTLQILHQP